MGCSSLSGVDIHRIFSVGRCISSLSGIDHERDEFELALCRRHLVAMDKDAVGDLPRGQQVLNVAMGGNLVEDIPACSRMPGKHQWWPTTSAGRLSTL